MKTVYSSPQKKIFMVFQCMVLFGLWVSTVYFNNLQLFTNLCSNLSSSFLHCHIQPYKTSPFTATGLHYNPLPDSYSLSLFEFRLYFISLLLFYVFSSVTHFPSSNNSSFSPLGIYSHKRVLKELLLPTVCIGNAKNI